MRKGLIRASLAVLFLENPDDATLDAVGAWTFGYLAAKQSDPRPVCQQNINVILRNLNNSCVKDGTRSLLERVSGDAKASTDAAASKAQARALLIYTTTGQLQNGDAVLREFPGGGL
ncbi:MAG: hypothetical protein L3J30_08435 [Marinosulfonomonas sp.]|nr:hypothetical protein [Marinosulfonomonas sp.]